MGMICQDTKNGCLHKHRRLNWNFEGFLGFACSCQLLVVCRSNAHDVLLTASYEGTHDENW